MSKGSLTLVPVPHPFAPGNPTGFLWVWQGSSPLAFFQSVPSLPLLLVLAASEVWAMPATERLSTELQPHPALG